MAIVEQWRRQVLPQGGIATPREVSMGETIGAGLTALGEAGQQAMLDTAKAQRFIQQKDDAAWMGKTKPQAILDLGEKFRALDDPKSESYVDPSSETYEETVRKTLDDYAANVIKSAPSAEARADANGYFQNLKAGYLESAWKVSDQAKQAKRISEIDEGTRKWGGVIVADWTKFNAAVEAQEQVIRAQGLKPEKEAAEIQRMRSNMAGFAMNGQASTNPNQFLADLKSGRWNEYADPGDLAQAQNIAEAEQKRRQAEARAEANRIQAQQRASVGVRLSDAISSVQANGGVVPLVDGKPLVTEKQIREAWADDPVTAQRNVDKFNAAIKVGQTREQVKSTTQAEDAAILQSLAPTPGGVFTEDDADVQRAVVAAIKAKQDALSAEIEQDIKDSQADAANTINVNAADWLQTVTVTGEVPDDARVAVAESGSPEAQAFLLKLEQAADLSRATSQIERQPESADRTMIERLGLDIQATGKGSGDLAADALAMQKVLDDKRDRIAKDPAGYFASVDPGLTAAWEAVDQNPSDIAVASTAVAMNVAAQEQYGLQPSQVQPLPNARAVRFASVITTAQPDQALATIDYVRSIAGDAGLKQVLGQQGIPPMAKFLAFADSPIQQPVRAAALEAMKIPQEEINKRIKDRGIKDSEIEGQVADVIAPLMNTLSPSQVGPHSDALNQLTKFYVAKGMRPKDAANLAWSAYDQAYAFHDTFRVPREYDDQKVQNGINAAMQNLGQFAIVPQAGGPAGAPADYALQQTIRQLQSGGARWVTNADDTGVILTYDVDQNGLPGPAVKTTTGRVELLFSDLAAGKYGFTVLPRQSGVGGAGSPFAQPPVVKPGGGTGKADQGVIDYLKGVPQ